MLASRFSRLQSFVMMYLSGRLGGDGKSCVDRDGVCRIPVGGISNAAKRNNRAWLFCIENYFHNRKRLQKSVALITIKTENTYSKLKH